MRPEIKHVVVLMLENRSFDHMLGLLDHPSLPKATDADEVVENPLDPSNPNERFTPFELNDYVSLGADPKHGYPDVMRQLTGTTGPWGDPYTLTNSGFAWNYHEKTNQPGEQVLGCYTPKLLPALSTLAREYAVCSRWFCSVPSETWPNRLFAHAATSDGWVENEEKLYANKTVFELLSEASPERSWQIFYGDIPQVAVFSELIWHAGGLRFSRLNEFFDRAREGRLPNYSFIEPRHFGSSVQSQHPLSRVLLGERLIAEVYNALTAHEEAWRETVLLITYDEHGGFYDRVPPARAVPDAPGVADPKFGFRFDLLGPRVPTVVISPWIVRGAVDDEPHDHTSIIATLRELYGFDATLTARDAAATGISQLLTRDEPRPPIPLPAIPAVRAAEQTAKEWADGVAPDGTIVLNDFQRQLVQLAQQIQDEVPPPPATRVAPPPPPQPPFESEVEIGEFVEAFRRGHLDGAESSGSPPPPRG
jgi:phospholipase C